MQRVREVRHESGIRAKDLATLVGCEVSAIYHYERDRRIPDLAISWKIVNSLRKLGSHCRFEDVFPDPASNK